MSTAETSKTITRALSGFGIRATVEDVATGAAVERYSLALAPGTKVQQVEKHAQDLAVALGARSVRIQAPIPGTQYVGVEVPAERRRTITLAELAEPLAADHPLTFPVGMSVDGQGVSARLDKCPHLLIAGTTGSGKSVAVTSMLTHFIQSNTPATLQLALIDPKRVELAMFADLPHLYAPVATEIPEALALLEDALEEMETRYRTLQTAGMRNIAELPEGGRPPYLVVVIDEMADLMLTGKKRAEETIVRLLQVGRAAGVHLVMATQRPSADIITGLIKANAPSRLVFAVQSHVDSNVALGQSGAEALLGMGDGLWWPGGEPEPVRIQGPFLDTAEINEAVKAAVAKGRNEKVRQDVLGRLREARTTPTAPTAPSPQEAPDQPEPEPEPEPEPGPEPEPEPAESANATVQRLTAQLAEARAAFDWADSQRGAAYSKGRQDERMMAAVDPGKRLPVASDYWLAIGLAVAVLIVGFVALPLAPVALSVASGVWLFRYRLTSYQRHVQRMQQVHAEHYVTNLEGAG